ncbi:MAG: hypothetical protein ACJA0Q_001358 [Saprospiraceae bacterium]|jgi:hypothetical protein
MKIKRFKVSIFHSMMAEYILLFKKGVFRYNLDSSMPAYSDQHDVEPAEVMVSDEQLELLIKYLKDECSDWKKSYSWMEYMDGTMWEVDIQVDDFKFTSRGHVDAPENFDTFCKALSEMMGGKFIE